MINLVCHDHNISITEILVPLRLHNFIFQSHSFLYLIGKGDEQVLAAKLLNTLWIQLGAGPECEEVFAALRPVLLTKVLDKTASPAARASVSIFSDFIFVPFCFFNY